MNLGITTNVHYKKSAKVCLLLNVIKLLVLMNFKSALDDGKDNSAYECESHILYTV